MKHRVTPRNCKKNMSWIVGDEIRPKESVPQIWGGKMVLGCKELALVKSRWGKGGDTTIDIVAPEDEYGNRPILKVECTATCIHRTNSPEG